MMRDKTRRQQWWPIFRLNPCGTRCAHDDNDGRFIAEPTVQACSSIGHAGDYFVAHCLDGRLSLA